MTPTAKANPRVSPDGDSRVTASGTLNAARLLGTTVIVTGISAAIALTIVTIGVDLSRIQTVGDLQGGIDLADRLLGYGAITRLSDPTPILLSTAG